MSVPIMIEKYNKYMGGVDKSDQFLQYHSSLRRTIRYWKTLFYHMLDVAIINSFVIYNWVLMEQGKKPISDNQFRDALILQLIDKYRVLPSSACSSTTVPKQEVLAPEKCRIQHGSTPTSKQLRCSYCSHHHKTSWTSQRCPDCPFQPALCQTTTRDCHTEWHSANFDVARCIWFSKMLGSQSHRSRTPKRRGRPARAINKKKRRGFYRRTL